MSEFDEKVYAAVRSIPQGKVATYGQIALLAGFPGAARAVGNALHRNPDGVFTPCYRVVNAKGGLSGSFVFGGKAVQRDLLELDGITVNKDFTVDLEKYQMR